MRSTAGGRSQVEGADGIPNRTLVHLGIDEDGGNGKKDASYRISGLALEMKPSLSSRKIGFFERWYAI